MELGETRKPDLVATTHEFGRGLATGEWTEDEATLRLSSVLIAFGSIIGEETATTISNLTETASANSLRTDNPLFREFVKITTRGILFREDPQEEPLLDQEPSLPDGFTYEDAIANSTEGIIWSDPKEEQYRSRMTTQAARLLRVLIDGLEESGYAPKHTKDIMREELDEWLDYLAPRTSYTAILTTSALLTVMTKARLHNVRSSARWIKRIKLIRSSSATEEN